MSEQLYLLGHPVGHSKSPAMYNAVYAQMGLPWRYGLADCETEACARAFLQEGAFLSVNVTTPYKPLAFQAAARHDASAVLACGANLLVRQGGRAAAGAATDPAAEAAGGASRAAAAAGEGFTAYNTDGMGCVSYLERAGVRFPGARVAVCGTGPTSLAILHACAQAGAAHLVLAGRDAARAQEVLDRYLAGSKSLAEGGDRASAARPPAQGSFCALAYEDAAEAIAAADVVVNATPLGMCPGDPAPFDTALLHAGQTVFDAVYGHGTTALVAGARRAGAVALDGAGMLVAQAVATVRIVCEAAGCADVPSSDDLFAAMASAAGFNL